MKAFNFPVGETFILKDDKVIDVEIHYMRVDTPAKLDIIGEFFKDVTIEKVMKKNLLASK